MINRILFPGTNAKQLTGAIKTSDVESVRALLNVATGSIVNHLDKKGCIPLYYAMLQASSSKDLTIITLVLAHPGIDVNRQDPKGWTVLSFASCWGFLDVVKLLLAHPDINVNVVGEYTALTAAVHGGWCKKPEFDLSVAIAELLLSHGSDINLQDKRGNTALIQACIDNKTEIVKLLLGRSDLDVNLKNSEASETALHIASCFDYKHEIVKLLLARRDILVNLQDGDGKTALYRAAHASQAIQNLNLLLHHPSIDVNVATKYQSTALLGAHGYPEALELLLAHPNINVNCRDMNNQTALMLAAYNNYAESLKVLLAHPDIKVNLADKEGQSALTIACYEDHAESVSVLLTHPDSELNFRAEEELTPMQWASRDNKHELVRIFKEHIERKQRLERDRQDKLDREQRAQQQALERKERIQKEQQQAREQKKRKEEERQQQRRDKEREAERAKQQQKQQQQQQQQKQKQQQVVGTYTNNNTNTTTNTNNSNTYHPTYGYPYRLLVPNTHARSTLTRLTNQHKTQYVDIWVGLFIPDNASIKACYTNNGVNVGNILDGDAMPQIVIQSKYVMAEVTVQFEAISFDLDMGRYPYNGYKTGTTAKTSTSMVELSSLYSRNYATYHSNGPLTYSWKVGTPFKVTAVKVAHNTTGHYTDSAVYSAPYQEIQVHYEKNVVLELMDANTQGNYAADFLYGDR